MCPRVSIVLPVYNGERYLAVSIDSILAQTFRDWELIIVDDGSTDNSPEIARSHAERDKRIRLIRNSKNLRLPESLNLGFTHATGKYHTWTSDDNLYRPEAICCMVARLEEDPELAFVYADHTEIDPAGNALTQVHVEPPERLASRNIVGACFLYRREVGSAIGKYDDSVCGAEDYDYWLRIFARYKMAPLHVDLYQYRRHSDSLTKTKWFQVCRSVMEVHERYLDREQASTRTERSSHFTRMAADYFRHRCLRLFLASACRAIKHAPIQSPLQLARGTDWCGVGPNQITWR